MIMPYRADRHAESSRAVIEWVRGARIERGWTQEQLAAAITAAGYRIGRALISRRESAPGQASLVTVDELAAYAALFGLAPGDLLAQAIGPAPWPGPPLETRELTGP